MPINQIILPLMYDLFMQRLLSDCKRPQQDISVSQLNS